MKIPASEREYDLYLGCVYIPPASSSFGKDNTFNIWNKLEEDVNELSTNGNIMLCGDFNARTSHLADYIELDSESNSYHLPHNYDHDHFYVRNSMDNLAQRTGRKLISLCIENNLLIQNGRTVGDLDGRFTCYNQHGSSVVDYFICSKEIRQNVLNMKVHPLTIFSDHCQIEINMIVSIVSQKQHHLKVKRNCKTLADNDPIIKYQ